MRTPPISATGSAATPGQGSTPAQTTTLGRATEPGLATAARLMRLYAVSRRIPAALAAIAGCAIALRVALLGHWDAYGALQLPLVIETAAATMVAATVASPFGEPERVCGRWLPFLRLAADGRAHRHSDERTPDSGSDRRAPGRRHTRRHQERRRHHRPRPAVRRRPGWRPVLDRPDGLPAPGYLCAVHAVARPRAHHAVALGCPPAARPRRCAVRRARVRRRARGHHHARRPRPARRRRVSGPPCDLPYARRGTAAGAPRWHDPAAAENPVSPQVAEHRRACRECPQHLSLGLGDFQKLSARC